MTYKEAAEHIRRHNNAHRFSERGAVLITQALDIAVKVLETIPEADVQPVKRGRWIDIHEYCKMNGYRPSGVAVYYWCSECMKEEKKTSDFCPNCGARMDGEDNG